MKSIINERNIKLWSTIGPRASLGLGMLEIIKENKNLMVITSDVSTSAGLDRFRKQFPENYLDLGIAEQNMIGVAAGLAAEDFDVVTTTFAPFQTMRCCEQIKVNFGYMKHKVCMVGLASGLILGTLGFTHCCIEDIGALRSIPGICIVSPSDSLETIKALDQSVKSNKTIYLRLTGGSNNIIINKKDYKFEIGKSIQLRDGKDVTIISSGAILGECLIAAEKLAKDNISVKIINMHTIKPIDKSAIEEACKSKLIVTVEEHNIFGGLGSSVAEYKSSLASSTQLLMLGINDNYSKGGSYSYLKDLHGISSEKIVKQVKDKLITA